MKKYYNQLSDGCSSKTKSNTLYLFPSRLRSEYLPISSGVVDPRYTRGYAMLRKKRIELKIKPASPDTFPLTELNAELKRCSIAIRKLTI